MNITNFYAELQLNPRSQATYRKLSDYYRSVGMLNEAEAYLELIRKKFNADSTSADQEQRRNDQENT